MMNDKKFLLQNSYYYKKIKENELIIFISTVLAIMCTMISYPGIWYTDSYSRVGSASTVLHCLKMILTGQRSSIIAQSWVTIIPSFFMAICKFATGNIATYTVLQAFIFFLMTLLLIKKFGTPFKWLQYIFFAVNPLIFCVSVYYEAAIGCVSGIVGLILLLDSVNISKNNFDRAVEIILLILFSFVTFGYRANAFTIIPVLAIYIVLIKCEKIKKIMVSASLVFGFALVLIMPKILNINTMSSSSAGFVWEMITMIQKMEPEKQAEYMDYLDEIGGKGSTASAIDVSTDVAVNGFLWGDGLNTSALSTNGASRLVLNKYFNIIISEPTDYFKVKWSFTKKTLGISTPIRCAEYDYNRYDRMSEFGFNDSRQREIFVNMYLKTNEVFGFFSCRPWVVFIFSALLVIYEWIRKDSKKDLYLFVFMLSSFYYGAYIINTQSFELRYFYPSLFLSLIMDVAIIMDVFMALVTLFKTKGKGKIGGMKK